jgi:hypothetical protein
MGDNNSLEAGQNMRILLQFVAGMMLAGALAGCMSTSSEGTPPNYVEAQIVQSPLPSSGRIGTDVLPSRVGGPQ